MTGPRAGAQNTGTGTGDFRTAYRIQAAAFADSLPGPRGESAAAGVEEVS
ncbi:hypothetical protein ACIQV3_08635 [Streptomyces sp. NPDC099050]